PRLRRALRALTPRGGAGGGDERGAARGAAAGDTGAADRGRLGSGGVDAREEHVLPPQDAFRAGDPPAGRLMPFDPRAFDPTTAEQLYRVPYATRAAEAASFAAAEGLRPAAEDRARVGLLAVDVQNTFCLPEFELFVAGRSGRGAIDDSARLC